MTPSEFSGALIDLGWTYRHLSLLLKCGVSLPRSWASGRTEVPTPVAEWLAMLVACHAAHPPPLWRKHPGFGLDDTLAPRSKP